MKSRILRLWRCAVSLSIVLLAGAPLSAHSADSVDLDMLLRRDTYDDIKLSPTGEYYAATVPLADRTVLAVIRRSDKAVTGKIHIGEDTVIADFWWVNNERVVASVAEKRGRNDTPTLTGELVAVNADGSKGKWLTSKVDYTYAWMHGLIPGDDRHILITSTAGGDNPEISLEKMDVYDGSRSPVSAAPVRWANYTTDAAGVARFARGSGNDNVSKLYYRAKAGAEWILINDESVSGVVVSALGFSADGRIAYLWSDRKKGPDVVLAWDPLTDERKEVLADPTVDPFATIRTLDTDVPVGARYMHDRITSRFIDPASPLARIYRQLEKGFPDEGVFVTSGTRDGKLLLVQVMSDRNRGDFYIFDTVAKKVDPLTSRRIWIDPAKLPPTRRVQFAARDGLVLHAYLTLPSGAQAGTPSPMVLLPHGGPFGVFDHWGFDEETQILAAAGYAVLRVNYRGSGNYGRAFKAAGAKQWGLAMQDDLTDATRWAIDQKIATADRICIYGASYGGYAALMGAAKEPELYRCAAGYVGVYDLEMMHRDDSRSARSARNWALDWLGDRDRMAAVSPTRLADRIKVPVFLAAGGKDRIAPIEHTEKMEKALKAAGVPVETLSFPHEGHGFYTDEHRREYYTKLLDFLSRHLGGARAKAQ